MGDRTTPMKFGPEWLRNLSREPTNPGGGTPSSAGGPPSMPPFRPVSIATSSSNTTPKVLLAKLRYGREEILALYDRQTAEAPPQLKSMELLYHPRGKPPYALNNNFEDDTRDSNMRNNPNLGTNPADRYGPGRGRGGMGMGDGRGRGPNNNETRGRARGFVRQTSLGRSPSWHNNGGQRTYPGAPDDDPVPQRGLWNNGNSMNPPGMRSTPEQAEWANRMSYRKNRQNHTNWRQQHNREEGEEWRSSDGARRGQEKWEREWPDRSNQEKPWASSNRRQWGGDNNDDALPEWAVENTEGCGGTFDSSGAFHGYSNDDSNLPKMPDTVYPLARSHTHGSFARPRTMEEGSDEWWASEKAKKLSSKRFDATEVKFKKPNEENAGGNAATNTDAQGNSGQTNDNTTIESGRNRSISSDDPAHEESMELQDEAAALPIKREELKEDDKSKDRAFQNQNYSEGTQQSAQYRIDMLLRSEERDTNNERGNYKSVMMTPNNDHLRQKHQNIGVPTNDASKRVTHYYEVSKVPPRPHRESEEEAQQKQQENKLVEDMLEMHLNDEIQAQLLNSTSQSAGMVNPASSLASQRPSPGMQQMRINTSILNQGIGMPQNNQNTASSPGVQQPTMMRPIGITNSMLNASLGLPIGTGSNMPINLGMPPPTNPSMLESLEGLNLASSMSSMQVGGLQSAMQGQGMQGNSFQHGGVMPGNMQAAMQPVGMNNSNMSSAVGMPGYQTVGNNSLFMQGPPNNMQNPNNMANHGQPHMYPMHGHNLQQSASQGSFNAAALYGNMMQGPPAVPLSNIPLTEQWYYEDPKKTIQGPFTSKEMYGWYRAGFFSPDLMVRRACESGLRPLANYGIMPFGPLDILPPQFNQMAGRFHMQQHENAMMNAQQVGLGPEVESLWNQPAPNDMMWMQQPMTPRDDNSRVNNLPMFFWDQPSGMLPEGIAKEMKTEDEILAQMRASQAEPAGQKLTFMSDVLNPEDAFTAGTNIAPNLEQLQKLIGSDIHVSSTHRAATAAAAAAAAPAPAPAPATAAAAAAAPQPVPQRPLLGATTEKNQQAEKVPKAEPIPEVSAKQQVPTKVIEIKPAKQPVKVEEKPAAKKEAVVKTKNKKPKEEKKDEISEVVAIEGEKKTAECPTAEQESHHFGSWFYDNVIKRLQKGSEEALPLEKTDEQKPVEPAPPKNKKEDKANKKDLEKEKKEWLKDGFTIVKGTEKKDNKKKEKEEARVAEEAEKKRKEDEKRALIEAEKNRAPEPVTRKQQLETGQVQRQQSTTQIEQVPKKAPWSAQSSSRDGLALSDIQRLEREKKLEQMKEQQQMMQVIAQQQAAAAQREQQELQAGQLGWAKKKQPSNTPPGQTLAEIQAEARKQAAAIAAAATAAAAREEAQATPPPVNVAPWTATNGAGFWDSPGSCTNISKQDSKIEAGATKADSKPKKKVTVVAPLKKEASPSADFDTWCTSVLSNWKGDANIDIPTFVGFLRDIESPYEVKDYVKCYLGDTKESNDFARQFLERRSRLLRVGMVTPSDDLCAPAAAVNPRTNSGSDYTEVKSKANKKTKKNKMLKIDARILGFSVTASEDRINIGDIDTV